jgi:hypothetical protein
VKIPELIAAKQRRRPNSRHTPFPVFAAAGHKTSGESVEGNLTPDGSRLFRFYTNTRREVFAGLPCAAGREAILSGCCVLATGLSLHNRLRNAMNPFWQRGTGFRR